MSNQHKRVNFSIFLDPINSKSDRYAYSLLGKWVKERKALATDPMAAAKLHHRVHMHKDIYLAGVYLYLLSPHLCEQLTASLSEETVNLETLKHHLSECGFHADNKSASSLETQCLDTLKALFDPALLQQELEDIKAQLADLSKSGQCLSPNEVSVPGLEEALTKLRGMSDKLLPAMRGMDEMLTGLHSMKKELVAEIHQLSLQQDIAQLKSMLTQQNALLRNISSGKVSVSKMDSDEDVAPSGEALTKKVALVKKLKSKGVF